MTVSQPENYEFMATFNSSNPLVVEQNERGYRYSIESVLLAHFVSLPTNCRLLDVGTGCGIIPLLLATRRKAKEIVAIEIQSSLYNLAVENLSKNELLEKIRLLHGDFINLKLNAISEPFDIVISNPPYQKLNTGRINPNQEKAIARHELAIDLKSLTTRTDDCLKNGGIFTLTYPPIRLKEVLEQLSAHKLFPRRLRFIHGSQETESCSFLIDAIKGQRVNFSIEPPLFIYNKDGFYSSEMKKIYASFNYFNRTNHIQ